MPRWQMMLEGRLDVGMCVSELSRFLVFFVFMSCSYHESESSSSSSSSSSCVLFLPYQHHTFVHVAPTSPKTGSGGTRAGDLDVKMKNWRKPLEPLPATGLNKVLLNKGSQWLISPDQKALFLWGVMWGGGRSTSHEENEQMIRVYV